MIPVARVKVVNRLGAVIGILALGSSFASCTDRPTGPSSGAQVTFRVVNEHFSVWLPTPGQIAAAKAAAAGGRATIPIGRIVAGTDVNEKWSWHLENVAFAEAAIEVCDGLPSAVEREGPAFTGGQYCPWSAVIVLIEER